MEFITITGKFAFDIIPSIKHPPLKKLVRLKNKQKLQHIGLTTSNDNINRVMCYVKSKEKGTISDEELKRVLNLGEMESIMFQ